MKVTITTIEIDGSPNEVRELLERYLRRRFHLQLTTVKTRSITRVTRTIETLPPEPETRVIWVIEGFKDAIEAEERSNGKTCVSVGNDAAPKLMKVWKSLTTELTEQGKARMIQVTSNMAAPSDAEKQLEKMQAQTAVDERESHKNGEKKKLEKEIENLWRSGKKDDAISVAVNKSASRVKQIRLGLGLKEKPRKKKTVR